MSKLLSHPISIYKITYLPDGRVYVGQTAQSIRKRFNEHCSKSGCKHLSSAIKLYGRKNFYIELITFCGTQEISDQLERYFIKLYDSRNKEKGFNISDGGGGGSVKGRLSAEARARIGAATSQRQKGKSRPLETREKIRQSHIGEVFTPERLQNMSRAQLGDKNHMYGKTVPENIRQQISETKRSLPKYQKPNSGSFKPKLEP